MVRVLKKTKILIALIVVEISLFIAIGILMLYALVSLTSEKEIVFADKVYHVTTILLMATFIPHVVVSFFRFMNKKIVSGILILFYVLLKLYLVANMWFFYVIMRAGGPSVDGGF